MVAFTYKPKFVDIRASSGKGAAKGPRAENAAHACDYTGCPKPGEHKAPKSTGGKGQYWHFCQQHAGEYNRRYDFFKDMTEDQLAAHRAAEETGHRPTWKFRAGKGDRVSAGKFWRAAKPGDSFGLFDARDAPVPAAPRKRVGRVQALALDALALEENATPAMVRTRYAELVKRYHPDSNGGDRSAEVQLQKVIRAFKTLKAARLA